ncbi:MAG: class I SAM-dependent methyltransferase [Acidimicrobiales bacterium]
MPRVTVGGERFSMTATVPEPVATMLQRVKRSAGSRSTPAEPLAVADHLPELHVRQRDPDAALAFLPGPRGPAEEGASQAERIASIWWYHTIELPGGVVTPGFYDHRPLVARYGLPDNLAGRRVLDVATFDGFWAFEMERRGAKVVATDIDRVSELDLPPQARDALLAHGRDRPSGEGFLLAHEALGSHAERVICNVYDLDPAELGTFDFVHVADLLLHLRSPIAALQAIRRVTGESALIVDCFDPALGAGLTRYFGGWSGLHWWAPSLDTLAQMVIDAGFRDVEVKQVYALGTADHPQGLQRAGLLAHV